MFRAGQTFGPYTLVRKLGRGGFGEVWLSERFTELLTTKVAVKLPTSEQVNLDSVKTEAALWAKASGHPNVLPIIEANIYGGQVVIVSEYADGGSLRGWLDKHGRKSPSIERAVDLMVGILAGLAHLHNNKITHRDLKPSNILLHGGVPRIADFGVSRFFEQSSRGTEALGTPVYMSPEAFRKSTSPNTDIWSVGVVFYEMLSGEYPFQDDDLFVLIDAIRQDDPQPLPSGIPQELHEVVFRALRKAPEERFPTADAMRSALLKYHAPAFSGRFASDETTNVIELTKTKDEIARLPNADATTLPQALGAADSVETRQSSPRRKASNRALKLGIPATLLTVVVGSVFWVFSSNEKLPKEEVPSRPEANVVVSDSGNTAPDFPSTVAETPAPTVSTPSPGTQIRSTPVATPQTKPTTRKELPRPGPTNKKKITLDDLLKGSNSQ